MFFFCAVVKTAQGPRNTPVIVTMGHPVIVTMRHMKLGHGCEIKREKLLISSVPSYDGNYFWDATRDSGNFLELPLAHSDYSWMVGRQVMQLLIL